MNIVRWGRQGLFVLFTCLALQGASGVTNIVEARGPTAFIFVPSNLVINVGDTVLWTNRSTTAHDVTQGTRAGGVTPNPYWAAANLAASSGRAFVTFSNAGAYPYICNSHVFVNPQPVGNPTQTGLVTVVVANFAPSVAITSPTNLSRFPAPGSFTLDAIASDSDGTITNVQFFAGANLLGSDSGSPYSIGVSNLANGAYQITARAFDNLGGSSTSAVVHVLVNTQHVVNAVGTSFSPNTLNAILGDTVVFNGLNGLHSVTGTTTNLGVVVEPFCGDAFPPSCTVVLSRTGTLTYRCIPHGSLGMVGSITVSGPNLPPFVAITSPANNSVFAAPATLSIAATASDFGAVNNVIFRRNTTQIGTDNSSPYGATASALAAGNYALTAVAIDNSGLLSTSAPVNISVITPSPIELRSPVTLPGGFQFDFTANPGLTYVIEGSTSQGSPAPFVTLATNVATNGVMTFTDPASNTRSNRAYRVFRPQ